MANFYLDNKELQLLFEHPLMERIVVLRERDFAEKAAYPYAPQGCDDALDSYHRVMELAGEVLEVI